MGPLGVAVWSSRPPFAGLPFDAAEDGAHSFFAGFIGCAFVYCCLVEILDDPCRAGRLGLPR
jgi:hypothetical protein